VDRQDGARLLTVPVVSKVDVLGVEISAVDMETTLSLITSWVDNRDSQYICVTGVHGVMESVRDEELRQIHNNAGLTVPDGMPMVWCAHHAGASHVERVAGPDLMLRLAALAATKGWTSFFYGGGKGVAQKLAERLERDFPGFRTVGIHSPPFRELTKVEDDADVDRINASGPDLVWIGLSTPKQERWMAAHVDRLQVPVLLGGGAAFDINAGLVKRAPDWMQRSGLEWLYRLRVEPRRLWRRYLRNNPAFVARLLFRRPVVIDPEGNVEVS